MKHNLTLYKQICRLLTFCLTYLLIFLIVLTLYDTEAPAPLYLTGIPVLLCIMALYERYCFQFFLYLLLHGLLFLPVFLIPFPSPYYRYLYLTLLGVETLRNLFFWMRGSDAPYRDVPWLLLAFILVTYILAHAYGLNALATAAYYTGLLVLFLHFTRYFIAGLEKLLSHPGKTTSLPVQKIMLTSSCLFAGFVLVFVLCCLFFHLFNLDFLLWNLGNFLMRVITFLISALMYLIAILRALFARDSQRPADTSGQAGAFSDAFEKMAEPTLLSEIATGILKAAVLAFFLYVLYRLLSSFIKNYMNRYVEDADVVITLEAEEEKTYLSEPEVSLPEKIKQLFDHSPVARIRRAYRTRIRHYKRLRHRKSNTSSELAAQVKMLYQESIQELTGIYQKARYSMEEITDSDLAAAIVIKNEDE